MFSKLLNSSFLPINVTLNGTITPGHSEPDSNGNEGVSTFLKALELKPHR